MNLMRSTALPFLPFSEGVASLNQSALSRPMQRKLVTLVNCQLVEEEGRVRAMRAARSLGERTVTELILQHQNPQQLSANLWAAVRARGCQFLGPGKGPVHLQQNIFSCTFSLRKCFEISSVQLKMFCQKERRGKTAKLIVKSSDIKFLVVSPAGPLNVL